MVSWPRFLITGTDHIMSDMLVKLYDLTDLASHMQRMAEQGITIRRSLPMEIEPVRAWVQKHFNVMWMGEATVSMCKQPSGLWLAQDGEKIVGFACMEAVAPAYFGPTGVKESYRKRGIGGALLVRSLHGLREQGHAYAFIGAAGPTDYYEKVVGAIPIPGSKPGIYAGAIRQMSPEDH